MKENKGFFLPLNEMRIVKQVILVAKFEEKEFSIGYFLYEREFAENYKMVEVAAEEKDFTYRFEYPQERLFPADEIDNLILQSVKVLYPNSRTKSYLIASTLDQENLIRMTNRPFESGELVFHPSFANVDIKIKGIEFVQLVTDIKIYNDFKKDEIRILTFISYYDVRNEEILDKIRKVQFF